MQAGADPNNHSNSGETPLLCTRFLTPEIAELLLRYKAKTNVMDNMGRTPLIHAVMDQKPELVDFFLRHPCDMNAVPAGDKVCQLLLLRNTEIESTGRYRLKNQTYQLHLLK